MRKELLDKFVVLATICVGLLANGSPVNSMLGSEGCEIVGDTTEFPYVSDGLVAMWDGEWNVGFGEHDSSSTIWKDLVGGLDLTLGEYGEWDENSLICLGGRIPAYGNASLLNRSCPKSVTVVAESESNSGIIFAMGNGSDNGSILFVKDSSKLYMSIATSSSDGIKNVVSLSDRFFSATGNWNGQNLDDAFVNGKWKTSWYLFSSYYTTKVCIGDRLNDSSRPFTGRVFHIRVYDRVLTDEEIEANYLVDKERFGL